MVTMYIVKLCPLTFRYIDQIVPIARVKNRLISHTFCVGGWVSKIVEDKSNSAQALAMIGTGLSNI